MDYAGKIKVVGRPVQTGNMCFPVDPETGIALSLSVYDTCPWVCPEANEIISYVEWIDRFNAGFPENQTKR